ncbi:MAG: hypothetical protein ACD_49C00009G0004 [uncultured bacterium (gcode 4)]|uniref:HAD-superfamily hydrolase, subfamily IA, variant 3 n=1 Tax=uncultured bacterium (gcode 4) TaxID=1234023 RepID=K2BX58_9BACT|nr:MAG: hypothetical protein ACD_49C00009G0004 [uncultured bacterium (gcode 4)]
MNKKISTVIFDYWWVISEKWELLSFLKHIEEKYQKELNDDIRLGWKPFWDSACIWSISSWDFWNYWSKYLEVDSKILLEEAIELDGFREDVYEFAKNLKKDFRLGIITNMIQNWFETVVTTYKLCEVFDIMVTSYETGSVKPKIEIFEYAMKKIGVEPEECVFIDDRETNIIAAKAFWMKVIQFKDLESLKKDFYNIV